MKKTLFRDLTSSAFSLLIGVGVFLAGSTALWASEDEPEVVLSPLAWESHLAIWTACFFILLIIVLGKFAFGPILKALDAREKNEIEKQAETDKALEDAKSTLEEYRQKLAESGEEARQIREEAKADAEKQAANIVAEARKAIADERERSRKEILAAGDAALNELATKSAELATTLAGKIIQQKLDSSEHVKLVERVVSDITAK